MRQSTDLSEEQVRQSVGGVGDFLRIEESDESPAARDTVGPARAYADLEALDTIHVRQLLPEKHIRTFSTIPCISTAHLAALGQDSSTSSPYHACGIQLRETRAGGEGQACCG